MHEPLRLGLVGAGAIAQSYIQALAGSAVAVIHAVADTRPEAAAAAAEQLGCRGFASHEELAAQGGCDAVLVCTPPATHHDVALAFLERGVPVLCEKPLSIELGEARALAAAAAERAVLFTMASKFRYVDDLIRAKALLASEALGEILLVENVFTSRVDMSRRWNAVPAVGGGGVIIDNGTHSVDIVRYLMGPIAGVFAFEGRRSQGLAVEEDAILLLRTATGVPVRVELSWSLAKEQPDFVAVFGSRGTLRIGWRGSRYREGANADWTVFGNGYEKLSALRRQVENFCQAVRGVEPLLIGPADAIASVEVIRAAYASLASGQWIDVEAMSGRRGPTPAPLREVA